MLARPETNAQSSALPVADIGAFLSVSHGVADRVCPVSRCACCSTREPTPFRRCRKRQAPRTGCTAQPHDDSHRPAAFTLTSLQKPGCLHRHSARCAARAWPDCGQYAETQQVTAPTGAAGSAALRNRNAPGWPMF